MDAVEGSQSEGQQFSSDYPGGTSPVPAWSADTPAAPARRPRLAPAIAAGIVAAIVAAVAWYFIVSLSNVQIGFLAIGVGLIIGFAMRWAAGGVGGMNLQIGAVVLTALSMFVAEFLIARKFIGEYFVSQGDTQPLALLIAPADMFAVVSGVVREDPVTLLFWAIALSAAWRVTKASDDDVAARQPADPAPET